MICGDLICMSHDSVPVYQHEALGFQITRFYTKGNAILVLRNEGSAFVTFTASQLLCSILCGELVGELVIHFLMFANYLLYSINVKFVKAINVWLSFLECVWMLVLVSRCQPVILCTVVLGTHMSALYWHKYWFSKCSATKFVP